MKKFIRSNHETQPTKEVEIERLDTFDMTNERKNGSLRENVKKHMGFVEKPDSSFNCTHCGASFSKFDKLQQHYKKETGETLSESAYKYLTQSKSKFDKLNPNTLSILGLKKSFIEEGDKVSIEGIGNFVFKNGGLESE